MAKPNPRQKPINPQPLMAQIHIAKSQLGMDEDAYRMMLASVTGKNSLRQMTPHELLQVRERMEQLGFKVKPAARHGARPQVGESKEKLVKRIEALLADAGRPWDYLTRRNGEANHSLCHRLTGKGRIEFCDGAELLKIIQALEIDAKRRAKPCTTN